MAKYNKKDFSLILGASNICDLEYNINKYFYSKYYVIGDDLKIHNDVKRLEMSSDEYLEWFNEFNQMFKIFKVKHGYQFYRYYGWEKLKW